MGQSFLLASCCICIWMPFPEPCLFSPTAAAARGLSTRGDMGGVNVPDPDREDREPVDLRVSMAAFLHTYTGWNRHCSLFHTIIYIYNTYHL